MKKNMGTLDKTLRLLAVAVIAILYFAHLLSGTWALVLGVLAIVFLLTSLVSFCPLYALFGMHTCTTKK